MESVENLAESLRSPGARLRALAASPQLIPWRDWLALAAIAVGGSLLYGASLALALPGLSRLGAALWLATAAGLAWCVFAPVLVFVSAAGWRLCLQACLVTMAYGEAVLAAGAALNLLLAISGRAAGASFNIGVVAVSNIVMASALAGQLKAVRVPVARTLAIWLIFLNGSGALCFWLLRHWLYW